MSHGIDWTSRDVPDEIPETRKNPPTPAPSNSSDEMPERVLRVVQFERSDPHAHPGNDYAFTILWLASDRERLIRERDEARMLAAATMLNDSDQTTLGELHATSRAMLDELLQYRSRTPKDGVSNG
jgi:hypothetical protein